MGLVAQGNGTALAQGAQVVDMAGVSMASGSAPVSSQSWISPGSVPSTM